MAGPPISGRLVDILAEYAGTEYLEGLPTRTFFKSDCDGKWFEGIPEGVLRESST